MPDSLPQATLSSHKACVPGRHRRRRLDAHKEHTVKHLIAVVSILTLLLVLTASPVLAGGDKVRGENGQGSVVQNQVMDPPPFQP